MAALRQANLEVMGQVSTLLRRTTFYKAVIERLNSQALRGFVCKVLWNDGLSVMMDYSERPSKCLMGSDDNSTSSRQRALTTTIALPERTPSANV
jgi:hypothetical protein